MLELEGLGDIQCLKEEALHIDKGCGFRAYIEATPVKFQPFARNKFTYSRCSKYIFAKRRFCRQAVGKRKGLFQDHEDEPLHAGACELPRREFYHFAVQLKDKTDILEAHIGEAAAYLFGDGQPLFGSEFARLGREEREVLIRSRKFRVLFFRVEFFRPWEGPEKWRVLETSVLPFHRQQTPPSGASSSVVELSPANSDGPVPFTYLPNGSPDRRLLGITRGLATPLPPQVENGFSKRRSKLIQVVQGLQQTSAAMKQSLCILEGASEDLSCFLECTDHTGRGSRGRCQLRATMDERAIRTFSKPLMLGQTFNSWKELKDSVVDAGVRSERVTNTYKKDKDHFIGRCRTVDDGGRCPWALRAIRSIKSETITITVFNPLHTCEAADNYLRRMHIVSDRLADKIFPIVQANRVTKASTLKDTLRAIVHPDVKYHSAHAARSICYKRLDGDEVESFKLIPALCERILQIDPGSTAYWKAPGGHFTNLFVCPNLSKETFKYCWPLVALDGAHTRSTYPQMLLLATALDANQSIVLLAFCMAPAENGTEWQWFMKALQEAIPQMADHNTVFVSDREKGLLATVEDVFPAGLHVFCTWHLGANVKKKFGEEARKRFEGLVYAMTEDQYKRRMERLEADMPAAAEYIKNMADPAHYSRAYIPGRRWGKESSQHIESINMALKPQRSEVAFKFACLLWDYMIKQYYKKKCLAAKCNTPFPPNIMLHLKTVEEKGYRLVADPSSATEVQITDEEAREFLVYLEPEWKCSCGDFQDMLLPCVHAWRAITIVEKRHSQFVSPLYSTSAFRSTYQSHIPALLKEDLDPNPNCKASLKRRKRGRPTEKARVRYVDVYKGERNIRRCRVCAQRGHDKRTCPQMKGLRVAIAEQNTTALASLECGSSAISYDFNEQNMADLLEDDESEDGSGSSTYEKDQQADADEGAFAFDSQRSDLTCEDMSFSQLLQFISIRRLGGL